MKKVSVRVFGFTVPLNAEFENGKPNGKWKYTKRNDKKRFGKLSDSLRATFEGTITAALRNGYWRPS